MATLYFNAAVDNDWNTLGNWWLDDTFSTPATALPSSIDSVIASATIVSNSGSSPTMVNFTLNDPSYVFYSLDIAITVTGVATFNGSSVLGGSGPGSVTGTCTFNDSSSNSGTITGNCTFNYGSANNGTITGTCTFNYNSFNYGNINGNCTFNDSSGNSGTITGDCTFNDSSFNAGTVTGTSTYNSDYTQANFTYNIFFVNGQPTTLDIWTGNGYWNSTYYIGGMATTLDSNGDGTWNGLQYLGGVVETTLYYNSAADTDWNNLSNWWTNLACTNASAFLPRTIDSVVFVSGAACLSNGGSEPVIKNLTLN